jgi:hypothetical protein
MTRASAKEIALAIAERWWTGSWVVSEEPGGGYRVAGTRTGRKSLVGHRGDQAFEGPWFAPAGLVRGVIPNMVDLAAIEARMVVEVGLPPEVLNNEPRNR